ncbi:LytR/AlgR family response regulator transcription factor [Flectobacillus roseus]|uniref:LytR/AlgR family response regulator transcription factor n=1 Tax=Flectobacillus roseus TaxID=502259 RepID=UPI00141281A9|nr:LytTR family DNA-binding domain-containing protein [Flectobacillus roseus]MDI9871528.1 LytTR family DNA-binding domain-containing protein [Flectobacillus roseus]NBA75719.1 response regulator [Emticicia sp. ODNR4P]
MKAIIIEDVLPEATMIKGMLNNSFPTIEIIGIASSVDEGISMILRNKPDFVLMDIEIMGGTSYDILASLRQYSIPLDFEIIFLTGNRRFDYATRAFEYTALDFLTKPIDTVAFDKAITRVMERKSSNQLNSAQMGFFLEMISSSENILPNKMAVTKLGGVVEFVEINQILYLEAARDVTIFVLKNKQRLTASKNLGYYDNILVNHNFFSISSSLIINLNELKSYDHSQKLVLMVNGIQLSASRRGGQDLKSYISQNPNLEDKFRTKLMEFIRKFLGKR